jgi:23S rRNA-intervening sequence protein
MLHIYPVILAFVADVHPFIERIGRHDPDLAKQLRRASTSVVLNTAEGMYARGRQRTASYNIALREMRESIWGAPRRPPGLRLRAPRPLRRRSKFRCGFVTSRRYPKPSKTVSSASSAPSSGSPFHVKDPAEPATGRAGSAHS